MLTGTDASTGGKDNEGNRTPTPKANGLGAPSIAAKGAAELDRKTAETDWAQY